MNVRAAEESDFEGIAQLAFEFEDYLDELESTPKSERISRETIKNVLLQGFSDPKHVIMVAEDGGELVGFSDFWVYPEFIHGGPSAYLNNLFISEKKRRRGVGSDLFSNTIKKAEEMGAVAMHISVLPENIIAQNFYKKNGVEWEILMFEIKLK
jgi:ribosomal protein S18 acetylase RimI-like enzyme